MKILNLGCGNKVSDHSDVINIDWSIELRLKRNRVLRGVVSSLIRGARRERFGALPKNILVHNLAKGLPFEANSVDVVYHSHLFEHLDREVAEKFLIEVKRVLKPGGIQRIVVPDLEKISTDYLAHLSLSESDSEEALRHDVLIGDLIEQCVRREAYGSRQQGPLLRFLENLMLGDARRRGETHQWMYDRVNLSSLLQRLGYKNSVIQKYKTSLISGWDQYGLDRDDEGNEYKPASLYVEAQK